MKAKRTHLRTKYHNSDAKNWGEFRSCQTCAGDNGACKDCPGLVSSNYDRSPRSLIFSAKAVCCIVLILAVILIIYGVYHVC